jgi:hypothetical protein
MVKGIAEMSSLHHSPFTDLNGDKVGERSRLTKSGKQGFEPLSFRFAMYSQPAFAKSKISDFEVRIANFGEQS